MFLSLPTVFSGVLKLVSGSGEGGKASYKQVWVFCVGKKPGSEIPVFMGRYPLFLLRFSWVFSLAYGLLGL